MGDGFEGEMVELEDCCGQWNASEGLVIGSVVERYNGRWGSESYLPATYLAPSFSNILGPCSCHSCFEIHMFSLSAICRYCQYITRSAALATGTGTYNVREYGST